MKSYILILICSVFLQLSWAQEGLVLGVNGVNASSLSPQNPKNSQAFLTNVLITSYSPPKQSKIRLAPDLMKKLPESLEVEVVISLHRFDPQFFPGDIFQPLYPEGIFGLSEDKGQALVRASEQVEEQALHLTFTRAFDKSGRGLYRSGPGLAERIAPGEIQVAAIVGIDGFGVIGHHPYAREEGEEEDIQMLQSGDGGYYFIKVSVNEMELPGNLQMKDTLFFLKK